MALLTSDAIPIADLNPDIPAANAIIHGIVTLVWPYSSVNHTYSFLLVEPDFRLRRNRGQIRVSLRGSCARRVTRAGLVSGDEIYLALDGAKWERDSTAASTPGRGIEWQLLYTDHLRLERMLENGDIQTIDTGRMSASPRIQPLPLPPLADRMVAIQQTPRVVPSSIEPFTAWSSPVFIRDKRLPDIFPMKDDDSVADKEEEWLSAPPAKKLKFGRKSDQWRFVERSPTPESDVELDPKSSPTDGERTSVHGPSPSSQLVVLEEAKIISQDAPIDEASEELEIDILDEPSLGNQVSGKVNQDGSLDIEHDRQIVQNEPLIEEKAIGIDGESVLIAADFSVSALQEETSSNPQSSTQNPTMVQTSDGFPELLTASDEPSLEPGNGISEHTSFTSDHEDNMTQTASFRIEDQPAIESQLLSLPQDSFITSSIALSSQTTLSQSSKPQLEINIQSSTPLIEPISIDTGPLTPRLLPLLSPGLDLLSPLEQQNALLPGNSTVSSLQAKLASSFSPRSSSTTSPVQNVLGLDSETESTHDQQNTHVDDRSEINPTEVGETFFNHLLARYDQAGSADTESNTDQPMSSFPLPVDPMKEDQIGAVERGRFSIDEDSSSSRLPPIAALGETGAISQREDPNSTSSQVVSSDAVEVQDEEIPAIAKVEVDVIAEGSEGEETSEGESVEVIEEEFEEEESDLPNEAPQDSDDSSDDDTSVSGKWRDLTYKPSQNISDTMEGIESSPTSVQKLRTAQPIGNPVVQVSAVELNNGASDHQGMAIERSRAIQDTYHTGDIHKDEFTSPVSVKANDVEVVDLLDSDSASLDPGSPKSQTTLRPAEDDYQEIARNAVENDSEISSKEMVASEEPKLEKTLPDEIPESSQMSNSSSRRSSVDREHNIETPQQEFFTAPADFGNKEEEEEEEDLTQIIEDAENTQEVQPVARSLPVEDAEPVLEDLAVSTLKPRPSQSKQHAPQLSQRITRSQSQQTTDAVESEDSKIEEHLEPIPETKPISSESTEPAPQGIRTAHDYYSPLATLHQYHNSTISLLAVVAASSRPIRSTLGPRDFNQTIYLTAPNSQPNNDFTIAQIFRPYESALPYPISEGTMMLLKNFKVQSFKRKMSLLSTSTSAWAVFDQTSATNQSEMQVSITGPPVDFGGAERGIAWGLGKWWSTLDADAQSKITSAATTAKDRAEADLEKKAAATRRARDAREAKTASQLQSPTTPRRQTRSTQSQNIPSSIPNTPSVHNAIPSSGRKRGTQPAEPSSTPTPTKQRHNLRSSPQSPSKDPSHELRSGLLYSDTEDGVPLAPGHNQTAKGESSQADSAGLSSGKPASGAAGVKTRAQMRRSADVDGNGDGPSAKKVVWHELRDGAVYKD